ncbi:hypothetical protein ONZ45_g254 [Pleurotus djamor]|nr:hypothetical protein ONZ45_g254 [Pleurotus djamor]
MASLFNLLNPDYSDSHSRRPLTNDCSDDESSVCTELPEDEAGTSYYTRTRASERHETHPDCPNTLDCLQNTDGRPPHTLPVILRCAILGSPDCRLTIREIYAAMENKYPYYRTAGPTWKQSVRHHLSLNRLFERQARPVTDPGFGSYWVVNLDAPPGTKRPRKRGRPKGPSGAPQPVRKRGRPKKDTSQATSLQATDEPATSSPIPCTDSGKTPDQRCPEASTSQVGDKLRDADDGTGDVAGGDMTDDEESLVDDLVHPFDRPTTLYPAQYHDWPRRVTSPSISVGAVDSFGDPFKQIERLQKELTEIKERTADSNSLSQRLSEQLAHAQAESWRAKAALHTAENKLKEVEGKLKEESKRRQDAERLAEEELMRRRLLEDSIRESRTQTKKT